MHKVTVSWETHTIDVVAKNYIHVSYPELNSHISKFQLIHSDTMNSHRMKVKCVIVDSK